MKKFIMYGAGNIGRGFIGQLFSDSDYKVGFVDINEQVITKLNEDKEYPVDVVNGDVLDEQIVKNVYGIDGKDVELVADEIASADIMATAIGVNVLKFIAKPIAMGLKKRFINNAKPFIKEQIPEYADRVEKEIGFVEASIGRMVPVLPEEKKMGNPLRVYVEPYNILPVDKDAFKGEIPNVKNLYPFTPFNLFIERKLFMHNMSHATSAYLGYQRGYTYIYQAMEDVDIRLVVSKALTQSAVALSKENGVEIEGLLSHADNLIYRFTNVALGDTVERVGKDTIRKLSSNDRLIGAINLCEKHNLPCSYLCIGVAGGLLFNPNSDERSIELSTYAKENGVKATLEKYSEYNGKNLDLICQLYNMFKEGKKLEEIIKYVDEIAGKEIRV